MTLVASSMQSGTMIPAHEDLERFHRTERLGPTGRPTAEFRDQLRRIPNVRNALSVVSLYAQTLGIIWFTVWIDNWFVWIAAFFLMGRAFAQFAALMHEAAHRMLFRNKK